MKPERFVDLLEGLRETAAHLEAIIDGNMGLRDAFHFHTIAWEEAKINIRRKDLNWLPVDILSNEKEIQFYQLGLGKGHFRIVGFWLPDTRLFHIVLLDPNHNIRKTTKFTAPQYCGELLGSHHQLHVAVEEFHGRLANNQEKCGAAKCDLLSHLVTLRSSHAAHDVIYVAPDLMAAASELVQQGKAATMEDIFSHGVLSIGDAAKK